MGQKIIAEATDKVFKVWEEKLEREFLWEIQVFKGTCVFWGIKKVMCMPRTKYLIGKELRRL